MNGARILIDTLIDEGVEYVFSLPGTCLMDIYDQIGKQDKLKLIVTRHEQVATLMADGYSRITGKPGVALVSRGPASCNAAIGLFSSYTESSPVVLIVGQVSDEIAHFEPFEILDFQRFFDPISKWTYEIHHANQIESQTRRALQIAQSGRPRPAVLGIPMQYSLATFSEHDYGPRNHVPPVKQPADVEIQDAVKRLMAAEKPIIFAGGGVTRSSATKQLVELAELLWAPVVTTWLRKSVFPNDHQLFLGSMGPGSFPVTVESVEEADVVLAVGTRFSEFSTKRFTLLSEEQTLIHLDIDEHEINKVFLADVALVGDAAVTLQKIIESLRRSGNQKRGSAANAWDGNLAIYRQLSTLGPMNLTEQPVTHRDVVTAMNDVLTKDTVVVLDAATFDPWLARYYRFIEPNTFLGCAAGCMGFGFPAAMGAKLANPNQPVVLTTGDGSFAMVMQDLATAVKYGIGIVIIVTNNGTYGNIRERQLKDFSGNFVGSDLHNPDFAEVARLFGAWGQSVTTSSAFHTGLKEALQISMTGQPALINVSLGIDDLMPEGSKPPVAR